MNVCHWCVLIKNGDVVQSVECLLVEQRVAGSNPVVSAISCHSTTKTQWKNTHRLMYYTKEECIDRHRHVRQFSFTESSFPSTPRQKRSLLPIGFVEALFYSSFLKTSVQMMPYTAVFSPIQALCGSNRYPPTWTCKSTHFAVLFMLFTPSML